MPRRAGKDSRQSGTLASETAQKGTDQRKHWLGEALEWLAQRVTEWTVGSGAFGVALATILVWG